MTDFLLASTLVVFLFLSGFASGKWQERREWTKRIPDSMDLLCTECERVGEDVARDRYFLMQEAK